MSLSVFHNCNRAIPRRCRSFNPSLCRLSPFLLSYICRCFKAMPLLVIYANSTTNKRLKAGFGLILFGINLDCWETAHLPLP